MGMRKADIHYLTKCLKKQVDDLSDARICELGSQKVRDAASMRTSKANFEALNVQHVSIDLNEKYGSLKINLAQPISDPALLNSFHIVTNYGTSEHVSTPPGVRKKDRAKIDITEAQYHCFRNIHFLLKKGGLSVHSVPPQGENKWAKHSPVIYTKEFFNQLAEHCSYEILKMEIAEYRRLLEVTMKKNEDNDFMSIEDFAAIISECCMKATT